MYVNKKHQAIIKNDNVIKRNEFYIILQNEYKQYITSLIFTPLSLKCVINNAILNLFRQSNHIYFPVNIHMISSG